MNDQQRTEAQAYTHFVDYTCFLTVTPFANHPTACDAMCDFFEQWLNFAKQREESK